MRNNLIKDKHAHTGISLMSIFQLLRPLQWLKNLFIFLPLFFSHHLFEKNYLTIAIISFFSFCLMASAVYCFNDIWDVEADRLHAQKRKRPIASGTFSKGTGYCIMLTCIILSWTVTLLLPNNKVISYIGILSFYLLLNIAYCVKLKHFAIVDVFIIALGFVIRVLAGGMNTGIHLSHWIILMTFLLALFLAFAKRRDDVVIYENTGTIVRNNVNRYNLSFMNQAITIIATLTMVCYIMYSVSNDVMELFHSRFIYLTSIFVLAGIIKYLQLTTVDVKSGSPTKVLMHNRFIQACIAGWLLSFLLIIYM